MPKSLRIRLIVATATATTLVLVVAAASLYLLVRAALVKQFDQGLLTQARAIVGMTEIKGSRVALEADPWELPEFQSQARRPWVYELWDDQSRVIARSPSLGEAGELAQQWGSDPSKPAASAAILPGGEQGRVLYLRFSPQRDDETEAANGPGPRLILGVGRATTELTDSLSRLGWLLAGVWAAATLALIAVTAGIIRGAVRPVQRLAAQIEQIGTQNLSERLQSDSVPTELAPIVVRLNELLARLGQAFEQERSFTADAAHELRTPLAGLEAAIEVCASQPRTPQAYAGTLRDCLHVVKHMHGMVENLLCLARADAKQVCMRIQSVNPGDLLQQTWKSFEADAATRSLEVNWSVPGQLIVKTDRDRLAQVLINLFDNAVRYCDDGGHINVAVGAADDRVTISIANSGSMVSAPDASRVFDRFWRGDAARSGDGTHSGLGLCVCRRLVELMGGSIAASSQLGGTFQIDLTLPTCITFRKSAS